MKRPSLGPRREIVAFLGALCLFLSAVEYLIPKPLPFLRLGLANLPLVVALRFLRPRDLFLVLILKIFGQGMVNGTLASYVFLFSAGGSVTALLAMLAAHRLGGGRISLIGVSLAGALASSLVQLSLAVTVVFGKTALVIAPLSLGFGMIAGLMIGFFAEKFSSSSRWLAALAARYRESE